MNNKDLSDNKYKKILIADSCAGGIAVLQYAIKYFTKAKFTFLADGQKNPFGVKPKSEIVAIVEDWLRYAKSNHFDLLIIACNTASLSVCDEITKLEKKYNIPVITMIESLEQACEENRISLKNKNVLLFGTRFTVSSETYINILEKYDVKKTYCLAGTETERLVAKGLFADELQQKRVVDEIEVFKNNNIDTIILACTCYEFVKSILKEQYGNIQIINLNEKLFSTIEDSLSKSYSLDNIKFITTGNVDEWATNINIIANKVFGQDVKIEQINIR